MTAVVFQLDIPERAIEDDQGDLNLEAMIFGEEEGDNSFVQNQQVVTIESIAVHGSVMYVTPADGFVEDCDGGELEMVAKDLQSALNAWCEARS